MIPVALATSLSFNLIVLLALRRVSKNPLAAIQGYCKHARIEHVILHVGRGGQVRQLCPCPGCRIFLADVAEHFERLENKLNREHSRDGNCVSPRVRTAETRVPD